MMLLEMAVNATFVLSLGFAMLAVGRRLPAALKHLLCAMSLGAVILLPLARFLPVSRPATMLAVTLRPGSLFSPAGSSYPWISVLWAVGAILVALRFAAGVAYLAWQTRRKSEVIADACGVSCEVRVSAVSTPLIWGWFRPTILLPASFRDWTPELRRAVLDHELAHFRRGDSWTTLLAIAAEAMYWFHPLVWWMSKKLVEQREFAADDRVLALGTDPALYASSLLDLARVRSTPFLFGCAMTGGSLRARVQHVLSARPRALTVRSRVLCATAGGLLLCSLLLLPARARLSDSIYKIGGDVTAPHLLAKVEPDYGEQSRLAKVQGTVLLSVVINRYGDVADVHVQRGLAPDLDERASKAVRKWHFEPATKAGQPVSVQAQVEVNFRLL